MKKVHVGSKWRRRYDLPRTRGTPLAIQGCPFNSDGSLAEGNPPNGNGCANRQSVSQSSADHERVQTARIDYNINEKNTTWYRFQADTGLQAVELQIAAQPSGPRRPDQLPG